MKLTKYLALGLLALSLTPVWGQPIRPPLVYTWQSPAAATNLTKFNLDFPSGPPYALVAAIEKATGKPLNVIIPEDDVNVGLPALKMNNVDVSQLFTALGLASTKRENHVTSSGGGYGFDSSYGFRTDANSWPSDDSIWYFYVQNPPQDSQHSDKICRYYQLTPYLNSGLSVDDITTAIQTGWKMLGDHSPPEINFHKETKLLIAVGSESQLKVIDDALKAMEEVAQYPNGHFAQRLNSIVNRASMPPGAPTPLSPGQPTPPTQNPSPTAAPDAAK